MYAYSRFLTSKNKSLINNESISIIAQRLTRITLTIDNDHKRKDNSIVAFSD